jgi:hypothetical protein
MYERQEPWTHSSEDEIGPRERAMLRAAHRGLDHLTYLRNLGAPWLANQDETIRREVDEAERELEVVKAEAISLGTHSLPRDAPDETCPGLWVDVDLDIGYCSLGDECRNPTREAHQRRVNERPDIRPHHG